MTRIAPPSAPPRDSEIYSFYDWDAKILEQRQRLAWGINAAEVQRQQMNKSPNDPESMKVENNLESERYDLRGLLAEKTTEELAQTAAWKTGTTGQDLADKWYALETKKTKLDQVRKVMWRAASAGTKTKNIKARKDWPANTVQGRIKLLNAYKDISKSILGMQHSQDRIRHRIATSAGGTCGDLVDMYCLEEAKNTQADLWEQDFSATLQDSIAPFANRKSIMDNYKAKRAANRAWIDTLADRCGVSLLGAASSPTGVSAQASPGIATTTMATSLPPSTFGTTPASNPSFSRTSTVQSQDGQSSSQTDRSFDRDAAEATVRSILNNPHLSDQSKAAQIVSAIDPPHGTLTAPKATAYGCGGSSEWRPDVGTAGTACV